MPVWQGSFLEWNFWVVTFVENNHNEIYAAGSNPANGNTSS